MLLGACGACQGGATAVLPYVHLLWYVCRVTNRSTIAGQIGAQTVQMESGSPSKSFLPTILLLIIDLTTTCL